MRPFRVLLVVSCLLSVASAQWQRTYGGLQQDRGLSVRQTLDGGYIAAGFTSSFGAGWDDVYLVRTDSFGDTLWTRCYGGASSDEGEAVRQTQDSGFVIAGSTSSFGTHDWQFYLIRTDAGGDTLWTRTYPGANGASCFSVSPTPDTGYILAGIEYTGSSTGARLVKTNAAGDTQWTRTYVLADGSDARSVEPVMGGGYIVAGDVFSGANDILLIRTDVNGDTVWTRRYGGGDNEYGYGVEQTPDSGFVVVGSTQSFGSGNSDVYLVRTDADGETLWTRTYGGPGDDVGRAVDLTLDGGYVITGWVPGSGVCLIRTNASGDTLWTRSYGGADIMLGYDVRQTADSGFIVAGDLRSDLALVKADADGNAAVLETPNAEVRTPNADPTIVRGVLVWSATTPSLRNVGDIALHDRAELLDISGRNVMALRPGANDVSRLAPGVYFVCEAQAQAQAQVVRKVVVAGTSRPDRNSSLRSEWRGAKSSRGLGHNPVADSGPCPKSGLVLYPNPAWASDGWFCGWRRRCAGVPGLDITR